MYLCAGRAAVTNMGFVTSHSNANVDLVGRVSTVTHALHILDVKMGDVCSLGSVGVRVGGLGLIVMKPLLKMKLWNGKQVQNKVGIMK